MPCPHRIADARNEAVQSGYVCVDCGAIFEAADQGPIVYGSVPRSPHWPPTRDAWLREHPACEISGSTVGVEVHHKKPYHLHPELELDPKNFVTLRRDLHLIFGHLGSWQSVNDRVEDDIKEWAKRFKERP